MILQRQCIECGKFYKFDPADGLPRYCRDCYYALGLGENPDQSYQGEYPFDAERDHIEENEEQKDYDQWLRDNLKR